MTPAAEQSPLGLIAGEGVFPLLVARGAKAAGRAVVCVGLAGSAWPELAQEVSEFQWAGITRPGRWIRILKNHHCRQAIMVGRVQKAKMYRRFAVIRQLPDWRAARIWYTRLRRDKSPGAVLRALLDELASEGITLIDSTQYCPDHLATAGVMTRRQPTDAQWDDIRYGFERCVALSQLDIGQSLALLNRDVIAVEALEGTDVMIERAGHLCRRGGWTMVKVANTHADMRLDVPTVGVTTIEKLHAARAACLALQPGKTIIVEKPKVLDLADRLGIAIVGYEPEIR